MCECVSVSVCECTTTVDRENARVSQAAVPAPEYFVLLLLLLLLWTSSSPSAAHCWRTAASGHTLTHSLSCTHSHALLRHGFLAAPAADRLPAG